MPAGAAALIRTVAGLAFPPVCPACGAAVKNGDALCPACLELVEPPPAGDAMMDHGAGLAFSGAACLAAHGGPVADCIRALKYRRDWAAGMALARLPKVGGPIEFLVWAEIICPVPLHRLRLISRGFNQAAWLAKRLKDGKGRLRMRLLKRTRRTEPQVKLGPDQRRSNVAGAFVVDAKRAALVKGRRVLIIDDVLTTGSTLHECALALRIAGAADVKALTISRAKGSNDYEQ